MISGGFRFACVAPVCGLACSSEAVMGLRAVRNSASVLRSLRAGRDSDGAPHDLWAGLLSGGAFVWRAAPLCIQWRFRDSQAFRAPLLSALLCAAFLPIRFRFPFKTLGDFPACCLVLNSRSLL